MNTKFLLSILAVLLLCTAFFYLGKRAEHHAVVERAKQEEKACYDSFDLERIIFGEIQL
jgi:hypothetical protein